MKNKVTVLNKQNLLDIAMQEYGSVTAVFDLALNNDFGITDTIETGSILAIAKSQYEDIDILNFYKERNIQPATLTPSITSINTAKGIGTMKIKGNTNTFIIG